MKQDHSFKDIAQEIVGDVAPDLTHCSREAIHIPGRIQPHGVLFALQEPELTITRVSANCTAALGHRPDALIGKPIETLLGPLQLSHLKNNPTADSLLKGNPLKLKVAMQGKVLLFDGIVHRSKGVLVLELEPSKADERASFIDLYQQIHVAITTIENTQSVQDLCHATAIEMRQLTGFDRVMIYQFDPEWNGKVVAEDKAEELEPLLGLQYPATDIPQQARELYTHNWLRLIPDVSYTPSDILSDPNTEAMEPLDLSFSVLRSVSPMHL